MTQGEYFMTENEQELLNLIRCHDDPEKALNIVINIILEFLKQDEPFREQPIVSPVVSDEIV